ncbi:flagellin N-terminal helical domain-containing protein [Aliamphritea hakodatensis]|uniref:flagellin N-terminal helical domain-containing protein n=1 Tax=Aliamphritea hakodatensis TaxID=2895352 RepID=UPI0022FD839A|nr:flagellin [Aliamphritea hakodatensis]
MALVINSNIQSLNAQRNLNSAQMEQNEARERLSSGKRINSAADDAAGLAISNRMTSQINGLNQAVRNANDGVSLIQTAEGALDESTNILQRMRELSIQSANGTYDSGNRGSMNAEVQQLVAELDRISETTSFNGQNILDGSQGKIALQVGSEANQTIEFEIGKLDSKSLGLGSTTSDLSGDRLTDTATIANGDVEINGTGLNAFTGTTNNTNLQTLLNDINDNVEGVTASGFNTIEATSIGDGVITTGSLTLEQHDINGGSATSYVIDAASTNLEELAANINEKTGGAINASIDDDGKLVLSNSTGGAITVTEAGDAAGATGITSGTTFQGQVALASDNGEPITITTGASGQDSDLTSLGFSSVTGQGEVLGASVAAAAQDDGLAANDLTINGVSVPKTESAANSSSLAEVVTSINSVSDDTGVTASIQASQSFSADVSRTTTEIEGTGIPTLADIDGDTIDVNGFTITLDGTSMTTLVDSINDQTGNTGVTAYADSNGFLTLASDSPIILADGSSGTGVGTATDLGASFAFAATAVAGTAASSLDGTSDANGGSMKINGHDVTSIDLRSLDAAVADINSQTANTGVTASIDDNGELQLASNSTITIEMGDFNGMQTAVALGLASDTSGFASSANDGLVASGATAATSEIDNVLTIQPRIALDSADDRTISIEVTGAAATATGLKNQNTDLSSTVTGSAISSLDISTAAGAQKAIGVIDNALSTINETRGELGAVNNRLDFTVSNLSNVAENASAARSQILDADFAAESANLSRAQVLQQAGSAMLAQANAAPQQVLSLLQ